MCEFDFEVVKEECLKSWELLDSTRKTMSAPILELVTRIVRSYRSLSVAEIVTCLSDKQVPVFRYNEIESEMKLN